MLKKNLVVDFAIFKSPWDTAAIAFRLIQEYIRLTLLSAMNLTFFLAIWQLVEAWLASHFLQSVHCIGSRTKCCVSRECVDIHFERLLLIYGILNTASSRFDFIWVWVQEKKESTFFACFVRFPIKLCKF